MIPPVFSATLSTPDTASGTVTVTVGNYPPIVVPWRGSEVVAVHEALDLLECPDAAIMDESCYLFVALDDLLAELTPEDRPETGERLAG